MKIITKDIRQLFDKSFLCCHLIDVILNFNEERKFYLFSFYRPYFLAISTA